MRETLESSDERLDAAQRHKQNSKNQKHDKHNVLHSINALTPFHVVGIGRVRHKSGQPGIQLCDGQRSDLGQGRTNLWQLFHVMRKLVLRFAPSCHAPYTHSALCRYLDGRHVNSLQTNMLLVQRVTSEREKKGGSAAPKGGREVDMPGPTFYTFDVIATRYRFNDTSTSASLTTADSRY